MGRANFKFAGLCALALALAMVVVAWTQDLPIRDPDGVVVPTYVRLPIILLIAWLLDVLPRSLMRSRRHWATTWSDFRAVARERWTRSHVAFAVSGLAAWYVCYAAFRNLKSYVPFVHGRPAGPPLDVLTGFLDDKGNARGRPVGVAIDRRGALLVADDVGTCIWRVSAR